MARSLLLASVALVVATAACSIGEIGEGPEESQTPPVSEGPGATTSACTENDPGPSVVRRLTRFEYDNTVRDLLGEKRALAQTLFPKEELSYGFGNNAEALSVSPLLAEQYMETAEMIASAAVARLNDTLACDPLTLGDAACAKAFIERFARRAYRRPPTAGEIERLTQVYEDGRVDAPLANGIARVIEVVLQSPQFLYRIEKGSTEIAPGVYALTGYEMATRLSYFLWGTTPDEVLTAAAASGRLDTKEEIAAQAERLLADPRAHDAVARFHAEWLEIDAIETLGKSAETFPGFDADARTAMKRETELFLESTFWSDGRIESLFTSPYTFVDQKLAHFYGVKLPRTSGFAKVQLDPTQRAGILTQGSLLAAHALPNQTSPVARGRFVRERILCDELAPPPVGLMVTAPEPSAGKTTRERFAEHAKNPTCAGCHKLTDPVGFGFEHYDAVGRWRSMEEGAPVDASGELTNTLDADGKFDGAIDLGRRLSKSQQVHACVVTQWFRYAYGRKENAGDACTMTALKQQLATANGDMRKLLIALTQTDTFRLRRVQGAKP